MALTIDLAFQSGLLGCRILYSFCYTSDTSFRDTWGIRQLSSFLQNIEVKGNSPSNALNKAIWYGTK
jgi:hypothetical protein